MTSTRSVSSGVRRSVLVVVFAAVLVLSVMMASVALARLDQFGGASVTVPYAPYTAGPVVAEEPYAPYTAGPVVREVPFAPFTDTSEPYAPYTAGPVVREVPFAPFTEDASESYGGLR